MNILKRKESCTGCGACESVCKTGAISLLPNSEGFLYPEIDENKCVKCNACIRVCPVLKQNNHIDNQHIPHFAAARSIDNEIRRISSSGGIFYKIASQIIENDGIVFGASFNEDFSEVHHISVDNVMDLNKLTGSKYVQSNAADCYKHAQKELKNGRQVLFSGTPCQVEGLKSFLKCDYDNLYTVDFICHGVPSPQVWKYYKEEFEKKNGKSVTGVYFRDKVSGWKKYSLSFCLDTDKISLPVTEDPYLRAFVHSLILRKSCYKCVFRKVNRVSDFTLADCWNADELLKENDDSGVSAVLIHSQKGKILFDNLDGIEKFDISFEEFRGCNPSLTKNMPMNTNRKYFFKGLNDNREHISEWLRKSDARITLAGRVVKKIYRLKNPDK